MRVEFHNEYGLGFWGMPFAYHNTGFGTFRDNIEKNYIVHSFYLLCFTMQVYEDITAKIAAYRSQNKMPS